MHGLSSCGPFAGIVSFTVSLKLIEIVIVVVVVVVGLAVVVVTKMSNRDEIMS